MGVATGSRGPRARGRRADLPGRARRLKRVSLTAAIAGFAAAVGLVAGHHPAGASASAPSPAPAAVADPAVPPAGGFFVQDQERVPRFADPAPIAPAPVAGTGGS